MPLQQTVNLLSLHASPANCQLTVLTCLSSKLSAYCPYMPLQQTVNLLSLHASPANCQLTVLTCISSKQIFTDSFKLTSISKSNLNCVSSQCACGKLFIALKPEGHLKIFKGKKLFKNVTLQILNFILVS